MNRFQACMSCLAIVENSLSLCSIFHPAISYTDLGIQYSQPLHLLTYILCPVYHASQRLELIRRKTIMYL